ncbi:unnamed protein product [Euphydryas editha]|uniref:Transposase n=1 Tax=Euphydryas editha TaxID=104508 RepID=A0AAU9T855_EUPED|nr:unnamed protein product [Euphydryas editha]
MEKIEYRAVIKFLTKGRKIRKTMVYKWHGLFKKGKESLEDDPRPGTSIEVTTPELIQKVEKLVLDDTRLKKKQLAEMVGVSDTTIFKILHDHLGMTKVSARWVPRMLTPPQTFKIREEPPDRFELKIFLIIVE